MLRHAPQSAEQRFNALRHQHSAGLRRYAFALCCGNEAEAEDLLQDFWLKVFQETDRLAAVENLRPYLRSTLRRMHLQRLRKAEVRTVAEQRACEIQRASTTHGVSPPADANLPHSAFTAALMAALAQLPDLQRAVIQGHDLDGRTFPEMAASGTSASTLRNRRADGLKRLRRSLSPWA